MLHKNLSISKLHYYYFDKEDVFETNSDITSQKSMNLNHGIKISN